MPGKRSYDDACGVARALHVVGERWTLLVVRELLLGPKRFTDLSRGLPGMSQNVLSQRLRELEEAGIVRRTRLGPPASTSGYELTARGAELERVLVALARWGSRVPLEAAGELTTDALVLALKTTFDPAVAGDLRARYGLRVGDDRFRAEIGDGRFGITRDGAPRGGAVDVDAVLETDARTLRALVFGGRPLADAEDSGDLRIEGDRRAAARFVTCFPRPTPLP
jgi:DNA-binding HxlR family transcriptional regulator